MKKQGFTIIEILITIFVVSVGILAVLSMFALSSAIVGRAHRMNQAYLVANQTVEKLRAQPFSNLNNEITTESITELPQGNLTKTIGPYNSDNNLKQITVQVQWQERGKTQKIQITSLSTPRGINN